LFIDLLPSRINDLLKLSARYRIGRLFWPILSTIGLSDFHPIVLTLHHTLDASQWEWNYCISTLVFLVSEKEQQNAVPCGILSMAMWPYKMFITYVTATL